MQGMLELYATLHTAQMHTVSFVSAIMETIDYDILRHMGGICTQAAI